VKFNSFNKTKIVSTGGNMTWQKNSQQFGKVANVGSKTGQGGQQFLNTKTNTGTGMNNKFNAGGQNKITTLNNKTNIQNNQLNTLKKTGNPQGIAAVNQGVGNKIKTNTGNTVRTNLANTQKVNAGQNFRANTGFKPNVSAPRVNVGSFKKK